MLQPSRNRFEAIVRNAEGKQLARCLLRRGRYILGHERKNEIVVDDASVSAMHARLTVAGQDELFIEDLESANGTSVNGARAEGLTPVALDSQVELGSTTLEFQRAGLPAAVFEHVPEGFLREHRYTFGEIVVQGNTSTIYRAQDTSLGREVAIKVMRPESQAQARQVLRFIREARITSALQHPYILPIYEMSLDEQSQLFYTTRFVEGDSLAGLLDCLARQDAETIGLWPLPALLTVFQKACDAVAFAHSMGVVHSALNAESITIGSFGEVFVVNWSRAKVLEQHEEDGEPVAGKVQAPPSFELPPLTPSSAPEQATESADEIDLRTDIYALGAILYRILFLRDAIAAESDDELLEKILTAKLEQPASFANARLPHWPGGKLPDFLAAAAMKALSNAPEDRPARVVELQQQISAWQHGSAVAIDPAKIWKQFTGLLGRH
jgi:serine/threonine protein kinase